MLANAIRSSLETYCRVASEEDKRIALSLSTLNDLDKEEVCLVSIIKHFAIDTRWSAALQGLLACLWGNQEIHI